MGQNDVRKATDLGLPSYLDMNAAIGFTKHLGGKAATDQLAELCQIGPGQRVLNVGCGSGHAVLYMAAKYQCTVIGVDVLDDMVAAARRLAMTQGHPSNVEFRVADAQDLPFPDAHFDVVMTESVTTFVPDKGRAFDEYLRVLKPGGRLGLNEPLWAQEPNPAIRQSIEELTRQYLLAPAEWLDLFRGAGFESVEFSEFPIAMRAESRSQLGLIGLRDYFRVLGRFARIFLRDPSTRDILRQTLSEPREYLQSLGYGLFVGQKPI